MNPRRMGRNLKQAVSIMLYDGSFKKTYKTTGVSHRRIKKELQRTNPFATGVFIF